MSEARAQCPCSTSFTLPYVGRPLCSGRPELNLGPDVRLTLVVRSQISVRTSGVFRSSGACTENSVSNGQIFPPTIYTPPPLRGGVEQYTYMNPITQRSSLSLLLHQISD